MATTYKFLNSDTPVTLTARLYADNIEVYPGHELESCLRYQWYYDALDGSGNATFDLSDPMTRDNWVVAPGTSNEKEYTVNLTSVANSGEYQCLITVGTTYENLPSCDQVTERRRVTIVECVGPQDNLLGSGGGTAEIVVHAPHYEEGNIIPSAEGATFITAPSTPIACDASSIGANVCRFVNTFTVAANSDPAQPQEAQVTVTVGELVCFSNIATNRVVTAPPVTEDPPPAPGPFINLTQDGPAIWIGPGGIIDPSAITVTATVGTIEGTGTETHTVAWTDDNGGTGTGLTYQVNATAGGPEVIRVTGTVTSSNGQTASASIDVEFIALPSFPSTITGSISSTVQWQFLNGIGVNAFQRGEREKNGTFTVGGDGNWDLTVNFNQNFFGTQSRAAFVDFRLFGPGFDGSVIATATVDNPSITREFTMRAGSYNWVLEIRGVVPANNNASSGNFFAFARNF